MKYQNDYTFEITVKDQYGMTVVTEAGNIDDLDGALETMNEEIEQYDRDLTTLYADTAPQEEISAEEIVGRIEQEIDNEDMPVEESIVDIGKPRNIYVPRQKLSVKIK